MNMSYLFRVHEIGILIGLLFFSYPRVEDAAIEKPIEVTVCQLRNDPAAYNHKLIQVMGFVSHGFEDFSLFDPSCSSGSSIWLEYGGFVASGTTYCCGETAARTRTKQLVVENTLIPLVDDKPFREFDNLIHRFPNSVAHATVVGRFFSGEREKYPAGVFGGYGHLGCCSLLAIQQIISVDAQDRDDIDYGGPSDKPSIGKVGCNYRVLLADQNFNDIMETQRNAELGEREWSFSNPQRVASEALARFINYSEVSIERMTVTRRAQGRVVYNWLPKGRNVSYMIVVSRPYWLSFYAKDIKKIAWVVAAAYESSCR